MPQRPGRVPRLEFAIPCRLFDNIEVSPTIESILEAAELVKPGRFEFDLAVKLFAAEGPHEMVVTPVDPKGEPEANDRSTVSFTVENPAWGERLSVPVSFPCETVGWWAIQVVLDGEPLGETHLWVQFTPY